VYKGYVTDLITDLSLDWISQDKSKPFCLLLFNKAPHRNWMPPLKYLDSFNKRTYPLPHDFYDDYAGRPALQKQQITVAEHLDIRYDSKIACDTCAITKINDWAPAEYQREITRLTPGERKVWDSVYAIEYRKFKALKNKSEIVKFQFQRYMEDYLRCIRSVDDNVGRVLKYLEDNGLADNTIIVYTSDQGFYLGEHGLYDKRFMYEESFRTPMLIRYPKHIPAGQRIKQFTLNLDMAPTLLDYTGTAIPADMQGASMRSLLLKGKAPHWRQEVYYHYYERSFGLTPHYGIRTQRYKLIKFYDIVNAWELYDLNNDPHEMKNLYGQPGYESITAELTQHLRALQQQYKDTIGMVK
jgi:arylsulfatase A-like enzyme